MRMPTWKKDRAEETRRVRVDRSCGVARWVPGSKGEWIARTAALALASVLTACSSGSPGGITDRSVSDAIRSAAHPTLRPATEAETEKANAHIGPLKQQLMGALSEAMQEGGPTQAIEVCRSLAPQIATQLSRDGVEVGRTSHRLRNPSNAARGWVEPALARYLADPAAAAPLSVELGPDRLGYVEPIRTQGLCVQCHGATIDESVRIALAASYPEDEATGFAAGDLRGVFWVEMPRR